MFQGQWHDEIDDAHVYEMKCTFVEAKHLGCYTYHCPMTSDDYACVPGNLRRLSGVLREP